MKKYSKIMCIVGLIFVMSLFVSCTNSVEYQQTTEVYGRVLDSKTGEPLDSIVVQLKFTGCETNSKIYAIDTTNSNGEYNFNDIPGNKEHRRLWLIVNNKECFEYSKLLDLLVEPSTCQIIKLTKI